MKQVFHIVGMMNMGGTETMLMNLYRKMDRAKFQFIFVTFSADKGVYDDEINQLGGIIYNVGSPYSFLGFLKLKKQFPNADIAHIHTYFNCGVNALWFKSLGFSKVISHSHTAFPKSKNKLKLCYQTVSQKLINCFSTNKLACSRDAATALFGANAKYTFLPNFVDPMPFIQQVRQANNTEKIQVGHVGRFTQEKNHFFILELAKFSKQNNYPIFFNLVGTGPLLTIIEDEIDKHNLHDYVKLIGSSNNIPELMNSFDCFVLPSRVEGFGLVLLEAQAASLQCFVSRAIQPEAILDLNLVKLLGMDAQEWVEQILLVKHCRYSQNQILSAFSRAGLDYPSIIEVLERTYE